MTSFLTGPKQENPDPKNIPPRWRQYAYLEVCREQTAFKKLDAGAWPEYFGGKHDTQYDVYRITCRIACTVDREIFIVNKFSSVPYDDEN